MPNVASKQAAYFMNLVTGSRGDGHHGRADYDTRPVGKCGRCGLQHGLGSVGPIRTAVCADLHITQLNQQRFSYLYDVRFQEAAAQQVKRISAALGGINSHIINAAG